MGDAFREPTALQELNAIGSAPPEDHVFKVGNFVALRSIQGQLQEKIFAIEGKWEQTLALEPRGLLPCSPDDHPYLQVTPNCSIELGPQTHFPSVLTPHAVIENLSDMFTHRNPIKVK